MKRLLSTLPLLAAIAVASYSAVHQPDDPGFTSRASQGLPVQMLPQGHPSVEQWLPALPEGHPPVPGYAGDCPALRGNAGENTDKPTVDAQELIST